MGTRYIGLAVTDGPQVVNKDVIGAASGGTLAGSQLIQVVFDDATFTSSQESKQRLLASLQFIVDRIATSPTWPIDSTT